MPFDTSPPALPRTFVWRRLHSLTGLWLVFYLIIHLLANSQAALLFGDNGSGFVKAANSIRDLPFLPVLEIVLLAIPFGVHLFWGVQYLFTAAYNSSKSDGSKPSLPEYPRNHAYTWQRITSWVLLFLITAHVIHMRFMEQPAFAQVGSEKFYMVRINHDPGIYSVAERLGAKLYSPQQVQEQRNLSNENKQSWLKALEQRPIQSGQLIAEANNFGTAELLMLRETFKMPAMLILYTVLVLSACFHAFNGLWTFCISWGLTLSPASQNRMRTFCTGLLVLIAFLGLAAIWGTYWINLRD